MPPHRLHPLLHSFNELFVVCKFLGIYAYELHAFMWEKSLKKSKLGVVIVLTVMSIVVVINHFLIYSSYEDTNASHSTLTFAIGLCLNYIGIVMMMTDQLTGICNQNKIVEVFECIRSVDERLYEMQMVTYNRPIVRFIRVLITLTIACELTITLSRIVLFIDYTQWISLLWIFSCIPTIYSSLDKIWFVTILNALKIRFQLINQALEELVLSHEKLKTKQSSDLHVETWATPTVPVLPPPTRLSSNDYTDSSKYSYKEINALGRKSKGMGLGKSKVKPICTSLNGFGGDIYKPRKCRRLTNKVFDSELNNITKIEEKLYNMCTIHNELCEIAKSLNELWSFPILVSMAHGFLIFTAQLYFFYCSSQNQDIPALFVLAKSAWITAVLLAYISGKIIYLIYLSWTISLESKRTGICLHKCGVAADNNKLYKIVNRLSLSLLSHSVDFSARGFFSLDMEMLFSASGGITSYLIILIQFNLATQQAKEGTYTYTSFYSNQTLYENGTI